MNDLFTQGNVKEIAKAITYLYRNKLAAFRYRVDPQIDPRHLEILEMGGFKKPIFKSASAWIGESVMTNESVFFMLHTYIVLIWLQESRAYIWTGGGRYDTRNSLDALTIKNPFVINPVVSIIMDEKAYSAVVKYLQPVT